MSNEKHGVPYSPRATFVEDLSPQGPIVAFDVALETVRVSTRALSRALAEDCFSAGKAADLLRRALAVAASTATAMGLPASAEAASQLAAVRVIAESMLALAPAPKVDVIAPGDADAPQTFPADVVPQRHTMAAATPDTARFEMALFRMRLGSLQRALNRLHTAVEIADDDVTTPIANALALEAKALPRALSDTSGDLQRVIDALETTGRARRGEDLRPQLEAAQRRFREVIWRRQLDAELFKGAEGAVRDVCIRAMLANVAMMIAFASITT